MHPCSFSFLSHQSVPDSDGGGSVAGPCAGLRSCPSDACWLGFQVPLLQIFVPRVLPPHPVCLQAALPGVTVHEHHPQAETGQVQRVRLCGAHEGAVGRRPVQPEAGGSRWLLCSFCFTEEAEEEEEEEEEGEEEEKEGEEEEGEQSNNNPSTFTLHTKCRTEGKCVTSLWDAPQITKLFLCTSLKQM